MTVTKLKLDKANRMLRLGFGLHESTWFARADLWYIGIRVVWPKQ